MLVFSQSVQICQLSRLLFPFRASSFVVFWLRTSLMLYSLPFPSPLVGTCPPAHQLVKWAWSSKIQFVKAGGAFEVKGWFSGGGIRSKSSIANPRSSCLTACHHKSQHLVTEPDFCICSSETPKSKSAADAVVCSATGHTWLMACVQRSAAPSWLIVQHIPAEEVVNTHALRRKAFHSYLQRSLFGNQLVSLPLSKEDLECDINAKLLWEGFWHCCSLTLGGLFI